MLKPSLASRILAGPQPAPPSYGVPRRSAYDARTSEYSKVRVYIAGLACNNGHDATS